MQPNRTSTILVLFLMAVPALYLAWLWPSLPDRIVTHWGFNGQPDGYGHKSSLIFLVLMVNVFPNGLLWLVPHIDPKHQLSNDQRSFARIRVFLALAMSALTIVILHATAGTLPLGGSSGGPQADVTKWIAVIIGLLFAGLGNYMTSVRPNYFVGIRTPWTLENETVWRKTHQLGGRLFFWCGLAMAVGGLLLPAPWRLLAMLLVLPAVVVPIVYSYRLFQEESRR